MLLGVQTSIEGSIYEALDRAKELKCNTLQIFSRPPQQWRQLELLDDDVQEFKHRRKLYNIEKVVVHIPYIINLASPVRPLYKKSIDAYIEDLNEAEKLGAEFLVTHMGSHAKTSEKSGIERFAKALNIIFEKTKGVQTKLLLENTSGSGSWIGYKFAHQQMIYQKVKDKERLGLCLDTAHAFSAGYALDTSEGLDVLLKEIDDLVGLQEVKVIHLNDSKADMSSHLDRHQHIGKGKIGMDALKRIVNHPKLRNAVFILETPKDTPEDDAMNLNEVRRFVK